MKKRLLSLLLAMAMIVSMVPFQALAEEPDETPALLEAAEGIAPEDETTEVTIPETTEETVPETTEETVPETTEETVPETTEETAPETTEELVPETTEELVPETTEETISEVLEETVPELSELILPEGEAPENAPYIVKTRIGRPPVNLAMIENGALAGCTFAVDEEDAAYAEINGVSNLVLKDITIPEGEKYVVVHVTATPADGAPVTVEVHVYAATFGIEFFVNDDFSEAVTKHTLNFYGEKSFTLAVKASDGGPLGNVKWTEPSTKLLKRSIADNGALTYTSTGKTGTAAITVTSRDLKGVSNTLTVNVVKVPENFQIKYPSSTRKYDEGCLLTAGQKLSLSTDLPKDTTGKVTWAIEGREYKTSDTYSLDTVAPEGASADGEDWSAIATIDRNKGVLTTYAGVTAENCVITVCATLTPSVDGVDPITAKLPVLIQPPVESFWVSVMGVKNYISEYGSPDEVAQEGAVNRNEKRPWGYDVGEGSLVLFAEGYQTNALISEVNWKISVSSKVAKVQTPEEYFAESYDEDLFRNTLIVTPKAPGKLTFTATSADGSGAKYSGTVEFYGNTRVVDITVPETIPADSKPVPLTVKAYYDDDATLQIAKPNLYWEVVELRKIDDINDVDDDGKDIYKDENGKIYSWVYVDGTDYYERYYNDAATIKNGKLTLGRITKNTKLLLSAYGDEYWSEEGGGCAVDHVMIDVTVPEGSRSLVIATGYLDDSNQIAPDWAFTETWTMTGAGYPVVPALMDADGNLELAKDAKLTVKGSAKKDADDPYSLYFYKDGTATITATLGKQKATATVHVRMPATFVEINNPATDGKLNSPVTAGKSVKLTATSKHTWQDWEDNWHEAKASVQKFEWYLLKQGVNVEDDKWVDDFYDCVTVENDAAKINTKTGVLTAKNVEETTEVQAVVIDSAWNVAVVTVTILPKDKTYVTVGGEAVPGTYYVNVQGKSIPVNSVSVGVLRSGEPVNFERTNVTVSPAKLAKIEDGNIVLTGNTGKATISVTGKITGQSKPVTVKATVNLCNAVTSIEITRPTNKDKSIVPAYVGKSLKLSAVINEGEAPATNKKLEWHIGYGEEEGLYYYDKTTIKNGVLKIDNSWFTESRTYHVWATSEDGFCCSDPIVIQAYAMTGAINIASDGNWPNDEGYVEYLNNRTVTIKQGETLNLKALVSDVTGYEGANPDVNWSISGKKGIVEKLDDRIEDYTDVLELKGLKPGTVTIKATAIDGSKKTATFKLVVKPHTLSAPELETDKLYRSCFTTAPSIAYDYTRGDEVINWLKPTDVEFSSDYSKVKITYDKDGGKWLISVDDNAKLGKVVTITVKDVRTDIEEIDRGQPLSMKFTIVDPQP